jgi:hypothetical protein
VQQPLTAVWEGKIVKQISWKNPAALCLVQRPSFPADEPASRFFLPKVGPMSILQKSIHRQPAGTVSSELPANCRQVSLPESGNKTPCAKRSDHYNRPGTIGQDRIRLSNRFPEKLLEKRKKSRRRRLLIWLAVDLAVAAVVIVLLLHKPSRYHPAVPVDPDPNGRPVDAYLHRDLWSRFYNNAQKQRPFEMVVLAEALNRAIAQLKWPQESDGVRFSAPEVVFASERIVLMGTASLEGAEFVLTLEFGPRLDDQGRLNLLVEKVKVGAMNVTLLVKPLAKRMYRERLESVAVDMQDLRTKIAASLFNEEPFEPVLKVEDKWVRLQNLTLTDGKLTARFVPAPPARNPMAPVRSSASSGHN